MAHRRGEDISAIGDAYFFVALYRRLQDPAARVLDFYDRYRSVEQMVQNFLRAFSSIQAGPGPGSVTQGVADQSVPAIRFDNVSFSHEDTGKLVLQNCSFVAPRSRTTLIVGRSGCGKSTMLRLAAGFLRPQRGSVYVNGVATDRWHLEAMHQLMSYCLQEGCVHAAGHTR